MQIYNDTVAVLQNKIIIFYSPLYICQFFSLHLVSSSLSLSLSLSLSPEHSQSHLSQQWFIFLVWSWVRQSGLRWWFGGVVLAKWGVVVDRVGQDRRAVEISVVLEFWSAMEIGMVHGFWSSNGDRVGRDWVGLDSNWLVWVGLVVVCWWCGDWWWWSRGGGGCSGWWRGGFTGMGLGLLSQVWVWVCCGSGFAAVGCGDCGLILFLFFLFFFFGVDGRLWVASGGGVRCV